jgi:hypothetical protein
MDQPFSLTINPELIDAIERTRWYAKKCRQAVEFGVARNQPLSEPWGSLIFGYYWLA